MSKRLTNRLFSVWQRDWQGDCFRQSTLLAVKDAPLLQRCQLSRLFLPACIPAHTPARLLCRPVCLQGLLAFKPVGQQAHGLSNLWAWIPVRLPDSWPESLFTCKPVHPHSQSGCYAETDVPLVYQPTDLLSCVHSCPVVRVSIPFL